MGPSWSLVPWAMGSGDQQQQSPAGFPCLCMYNQREGGHLEQVPMIERKATVWDKLSPYLPSLVTKGT